MHPRIHFTDSSLFNPVHPIEVNLIGAGGTGSQVLTALARLNCALNALGHAGLFLRLWDDDKVSEANLGRQLFAECELGLFKSSALINRCNRFFGTDWKAETVRFEKDAFGRLPAQAMATLYVSCTDSVKARFGIADILNELKDERDYCTMPKYWLDFGNSRYSGQVILSTVGEIEQPRSKQYETVAKLPFITEEYGEQLVNSETADDTPSCSLAEALEKQDLFINSTLAQMGCSLLWSLLRNGMTENRGFFLNLRDFRSLPLPVG